VAPPHCGTLEKAVCAIVVKGLYIRGGCLTWDTPPHPPTCKFYCLPHDYRHLTP